MPRLARITACNYRRYGAPTTSLERQIVAASATLWRKRNSILDASRLLRLHPSSVLPFAGGRSIPRSNAQQTHSPTLS